MLAVYTPDDMVSIIQETVVALVRKDGPDLNARQLGVLLTCYLDPNIDHTVRGLAEKLRIGKPAVTRALDRLTGLNLLIRKADDRDRRSVLVQRTVGGESFIRDLRGLLTHSITVVEKISV